MSERDEMFNFFWRKSKTPVGVEILTLTVSDLHKLNFYQFRTGTAQFFFDLLGRTNVTVADTPHFRFASALLAGNDNLIREAEAYYHAYLSASWRCDASDPRIPLRSAEFRETLAHYKANGFNENPVLIRLPTSDEPYVVDGNHRTSMAAALGQPLQVEIWPVAAAFLKFNQVKEFYGTGNRDMPYQSLFLKGEEVIVGRRRDLKDRLALVPSELISGRDVLDVACNVGMSALLSRELGARSCTGLEYSAAMVDIANRFAMFSNAYPAVSYRQFNIDTDLLPADQIFDTAFMFSIHDHLKQPSKLTLLADRHVRSAVLFEAHPGGKLKDYAGFLQSGLFESVTEIGRLNTSSTQADQSRTLWLCLKSGN